MNKPKIKLAMSPDPRTLALIEGKVEIDGYELDISHNFLSPGELHLLESVMLFPWRKKIMADVQFVTVDLNLAFNQCKGPRIRRHRQFYFWFIHSRGFDNECVLYKPLHGL